MIHPRENGTECQSFSSRQAAWLRYVQDMDAVLKKSTRPPLDQPCPCGSGKIFGDCCDPILTGKRQAATAEELMRARFSAHVAQDFLFLHNSHRPTAGRPFVEPDGPPAVRWAQLVVHSQEVSSDPNKAFVDFSAYGVGAKGEEVLHERSEFLKVNGAWLYNREARLGPAPIRSLSPKISRNDKCPCGSGKKYKHCCLLKK
jgi:SEC-C motif-containing protein